MDRQWEQKLRDKMSQYSQPEPEGLWEDILRQMDSGHPLHTVPAKDRKKTFILSMLTAAAAIAAIVMLTYPEIPHQTPESKAFALAGSRTIISQEIPAPGKIHLQDRSSSTVSEQLYTSPSTSPSVPDTTTVPSADPVSETVSKAPETALKPEGPDTYSSGNDDFEDAFDNSIFEDEDIKSRKRKGRRFSTSVYASNLTGSRQQFNGYSTIQPAAASFKGIPTKEAISPIPGNGVMLLSEGNSSNTEIRHRQPIRAGVSFKYYLTDRWGIESGLVYSFLDSRMETGNSTMYSSTTDQTLHYLGIPLRISYNIFDRKFLTIYASAGGMLEKCVSGKTATSTSMNGYEIENRTDKIMIRPVQWSVSAEAGIQGNITNYLGIYIEPGVSWHFDNGSIISTAYKEKPLNFNLEFGLRFSFE